MNRKKQIAAVKKELAALARKETRLCRGAEKGTSAGWKEALEHKIPQKVYFGLESAFGKGFSLVFRKGTFIIEKGYRKENLLADHAIRDFAFGQKGKRKELKQMGRSAKRADRINLTLTTAEGLALGFFGIGMPDVVLFLATVLKGVYETALHYGFGYNTPQEQLLILKMMAASLSYGEDSRGLNREVDQMLILETPEVTPEELQQQIRKTASVFAMDMLLLKFIQGFPIVGLLGGAANPVYYRKIMKYTQLKYRKRYLLRKKEALEHEQLVKKAF